MICIDNPYRDASFNLSAEEYLLKNSSQDVFMLWQNEPCAIIGKHQNMEAEVNMDFARHHQIHVIRRHSGGGAVFQDAGNLNLTFIESSRFPDFNKYTQYMQDFLSSMGIHTQADKRGALFLNGLKISGSAQFIRKQKVLFHATLLFSTDLGMLSSTLDSKESDSTPQKQYVKSVRSPVTNICEHLNFPLNINEFKTSIIHYFLQKDSNNSMYSFHPEEVAAINTSSICPYLI
jgi:lipoate---protein ligase